MAYGCFPVSMHSSYISTTPNLPIYTLHIRHTLLTLRPLLEAVFMDIVATSSFAPHNLLVLWLEFHEADGAIAGNFFAI